MLLRVVARGFPWLFLFGGSVPSATAGPSSGAVSVCRGEIVLTVIFTFHTRLAGFLFCAPLCEHVRLGVVTQDPRLCL